MAVTANKAATAGGSAFESCAAYFRRPMDVGRVALLGERILRLCDSELPISDTRTLVDLGDGIRTGSVDRCGGDTVEGTLAATLLAMLFGTLRGAADLRRLFSRGRSMYLKDAGTSMVIDFSGLG